jgi:polyisoprenoid-binding protein YceI
VTGYRIVAQESTVHIGARSNVHPINTRTAGLEGFVDLEFDDDGNVDLASTPAGRLSFPVDLLRSGNPFEDRELRKRIDARHFPTIAGVMTAMAPAPQPGRYLVSGDLTFRGVTRAHTGEMDIEAVDADTIRLVGESGFDVRDFGMQPPRILMLRVEPEVTVRVELVARRATGRPEGSH